MDCPHIPKVSGDAFGRRLRDKIGQQRIPASGIIELTQRCNLNCAHCYVNLPAGDREARSREMTAEQVKDIVDQAVEHELLWLTFTGGEPLLWKGFLPVYEHAKRKGVLVTLFTNGTLITPEIADYLAEWPPLAVEITLYGRTKETYERVTQVPGSYERCMQGIQLLVDRGVPTTLKAMVLALNQHELWDIKRFAEDLVDHSFRYDLVIHPRREDRSIAPIEHRLPAHEIVQLELRDHQRVEELSTFYETHKGPFHSESRYLCRAGHGGFFVDAYGCMRVCLMSREQRYDLLSGSFQEGWFEWIPRVLAQKPAQWSACRDCELIALCSNCPAWGESVHGVPEIIPIDFLCQLAHLRVKEFDARVNGRYGVEQ